MKSKKQALRILLCALLMLVVIFATASCDKIAEIFNKHEHEYVTVVTPPTCTEQGYTTYTCLCGDTYDGDYLEPRHSLVSYSGVAPTCTEAGYEDYDKCTKCDYTTYKSISALGHDNVEKVTRFPTTTTQGIKSNMCQRCGECTNVYLDTVSFELPAVAEFFRSIVGNNVLEIRAKDSDITLIKELYGGDEDSTYEKNYLAIKLGYLKINGESELLDANLSFEIGVASYDSLSEDAEPIFYSEIALDLIVLGEQVSVSLNEDGELTEGDYELSEQFYTALASVFGMEYDEFVDSVYVGEKISQILPLLQGLVDLVGEIPEPALGLEMLLTLIGENIVVQDGNTYTLHFAGLTEHIKSLQGKTVEALIDGQYGAGTAKRIEDFLVGLPTMKLRDVADALVDFSEKCDVPIDEVYSLVNYLVYASAGVDFNIESEIKSRYDMTLTAVILELSGKDYTDDEVAAETDKLVANIKQLVGDIKGYDVDKLYNYINYGNPTHSVSATGEIFRITDSLIHILELYDENLTLTVTLNDEGGLESFSLAIEDALIVYASLVPGSEHIVIEYVQNHGSYTNDYVVELTNGKDGTVFSVKDGELTLAYLAVVKNELSEITSLDFEYYGMLMIDHSQNPDDEGSNQDSNDGNGDAYDTEEIDDEGDESSVSKTLDLICKVTYRNNGDTLSLVIEEPDRKHVISATVTETEQLRTVMGSIASEYYDTYTTDEGSFIYTEKLDGTGVTLDVSVDEVTYDYTTGGSREDGTYEEIYDFDNEKRYNTLTLNYTNDGAGNITLTVDSNNVYHDGGVSNVEDNGDVTLTVTTDEDSVVANLLYRGYGDEVWDNVYYSNVATDTGYDVTLKGTYAEGICEFDISASYVTEEYEDEELGTLYSERLTSLNVKLTVNEERVMTVKLSAVEVNGGLHVVLDVDGLQYVRYDYEYVGGNNGNDGDGDTEDPDVDDGLSNSHYPWGKTTIRMQINENSDAGQLPSVSRRYLAGDLTGNEADYSCVDDYVADRNKAATEYTNVAVEYVYLPDTQAYGWGNNVQLIFEEVMCYDPERSDVYVNFAYDIVLASLKGAFANLNSTTMYEYGHELAGIEHNYFDFAGDYSYYDTGKGYMYEYMRSLSLSKYKMYALASDYFTDVIRATLVVPVNIGLLETLQATYENGRYNTDRAVTFDMAGNEETNYTIEDFYQLVWDGEWTYETLAAFSSAISNDCHGDYGLELGDIVGFALDSSSGLSAAGLLYSSSVTVIDRMYDVTKGDYTYSYPGIVKNGGSFLVDSDWLYGYGDYGLFTFCENLSALFNSDGVISVDHQDAFALGCSDATQGILKSFADGNILFGGIVTLGSLERDEYKEMNYDGQGFAIVPVPLYSSDSGYGYLTHIHNNAKIGAISYSTENFAQCTAYLNYQSTHSSEVLNEYYNFKLTYDVAGGVDGSRDMLQYLRANVRSCFDKTFEDAIAGFFSEMTAGESYMNTWHFIIKDRDFQVEDMRSIYASVAPVKAQRLYLLENGIYPDLPN